MRVEQARGELEALEQALAEAHYQQLSGLQPGLDTGPVYARHQGLFERSTVDAALAEARAPGAPNRARFLAQHLAHGYLDARLQPLTDAAERIEGTLEVPVAGQRVPYRMLAVRIANEPHRERRATLAMVQARATEEHLNPLLRKRWEQAHALARDLGHKDYAAMCGALKGLDYAAFRDALDPLVRRTEALYRWHMEGLLGRGVSVMLAMAERHDVAYTLRASWFDDQFPRGGSVPALEKVLQGMGLTLQVPNVALDIEERPAKSPRAFVVPVRVPEDVRLVVQPKGGQDDYRSLFHEAGHALHFGHARRGLEVEYRYLGDNSVTEAFAFLLEHVLAEQAWADAHLAPILRERYVWQQRIVRLYMVRRYVAKLRYEVALHTQGLQGGEEQYKRTLDRVLVFANPRASWLADVDDAFYAANYLRAWALESVLRAQMKQRFGERWWEHRGAGELLKGLWAQGQRWTAEELCKELGASFSLEPLVQELVDSLKQEPKDFHALPKF